MSMFDRRGRRRGSNTCAPLAALLVVASLLCGVRGDAAAAAAAQLAVDMASGEAASLDTEAEAVLDSAHTFHLQSGVGNEFRLVLHVAQDFLADFVPGLL